jgi:peptidyl-tRNA hydrolase
VKKCDSEKELYDIQAICECNNILNALIIDEGSTEFKEMCPDCDEGYEITKIANPYKPHPKCSKCNGTGKINKPTPTCIAVGPDYSDVIDKITSKYKLL